MGRPATATKILEARGAFKKNPNRARPYEPEVKEPFPKDPPKHLARKQKATWREIVSYCPFGVLTRADRFPVEVAACLLAEYREDPDAMPTARIGRMCAEFGRLGLSPADRTRSQVPKGKKNEFD